jgi:hypothetical protein
LKVNRKRLGTGEDVQIVDDSASPQVEQILAYAPIAGALSLPSTDMRERMLNGDPLAQFLAALRRLLSLAQFDQEGFIRMNTHASPFRTGGALGFERALGTDVFGKVNHSPGDKGHFLRSRTADHLPLPIEDKSLLVKAFAFADGPGFAIHF